MRQQGLTSTISAVALLAVTTMSHAPVIEPATLLFFPLVVNDAPPRLGIQLDGAIREYGWQPWLIENRLYVINLRWQDAQPEPGDVTWPDYLIDNITALKGQPFIISVKVAPEWARLWPEVIGSPVKRETWEAFTGLIVRLAAEFQPWGIGLFNEPDVPAEASQDMLYYGGWLREGDDSYQAGRFYGEFTGYVYTRFKERLPERPRLIVLELCGDLDFARGAYDGGLAGDLVGLHKYIGQGGDFEAVYQQAQIVSQIAGLQPIVTETNLLGDGGATHRAEQAAYMQYLNLRQSQYEPGWDQPLSVIVYALGNDWGGADLVHHGEPTPGYFEWAREGRP